LSLHTKERYQFSDPRLCLYNKIFSSLNKKYINAAKVACVRDKIVFLIK
jgi:hypothetical protein